MRRSGCWATCLSGGNRRPSGRASAPALPAQPAQEASWVRPTGFVATSPPFRRASDAAQQQYRRAPQARQRGRMWRSAPPRERMGGMKRPPAGLPAVALVLLLAAGGGGGGGGGAGDGVGGQPGGGGGAGAGG